MIGPPDGEGGGQGRALQEGEASAAARVASDLGYRVVALHGVRDDGSCTCARGRSCPSAGKHPRGKGWQNDAGTVERFRELVEGHAAFNVGVRLDADAPVPLVLLDIDTKHGKPGAASMAGLKAQCGPLPENALLQTTPSGGEHYLLRVPANVDPRALPNRADVFPGVDVFTHQRQFVLAPSRTARGAYTFAGGRGLVPPADVPVLPNPWAERLRSMSAATGASSGVTADPDPAPDPQRVIQLLDVLPAPKENTRDECVAFAHAVHGALVNARPEQQANAETAFLRWAGRWPGADPHRDQSIWETTRGTKHRGWRHVCADAEGFITRARAATNSEDAGTTDGASVDAAKALLDTVRAEAACEAFPAVPGLQVRPAHAAPDVSALYRQALGAAVEEARRNIPNSVERAMHFDIIAAAIGKQFAMNARVVGDSLRALDAQADRAAVYAPNVEWLGLEDRDRLALTTPRYLVSDYLFADGAIHIVYGAPGSRKTFLALSWLLSIVADRPWAGRFPVRRGGALFFAGEAAATLRVRRAAALAALAVTPEMAASLPFGVVPELPPLGTTDGVDAVLRLVDEHYRTRHSDAPLSVIGFDTLTRLSQRAGASTTDPKEYGVLLDRVEQIAHATGASVVLVAHSPENNADKPTGTYQTRGNADSVIKVERVDDTSSRLTVEKAKDDVEGAPLLLRFAPKDVRQWLADSYEREKRALPSPLEAALAAGAFATDTEGLPSEEALADTGMNPLRVTEDAARQRQFTSLVLTDAVPETPRANGSGSREALVEAHLLAWIDRHPGSSKRALRDSWSGRGTAVDRALVRLLEQGRIEDRGSSSRSAYHRVGATEEVAEQAIPAVASHDVPGRPSPSSESPLARGRRRKGGRERRRSRARDRVAA